MRLIIAGGRDYKLTAEDYARLEAIRPLVTMVVSGGAAGADRCGEAWAKQHSLPVTIFPAQWTKFGKIAGNLRNRQMAEYANAVALFPGGRGTENMYKTAVSFGLTIYDFRLAPRDENLTLPL